MVRVGEVDSVGGGDVLGVELESPPQPKARANATTTARGLE
jgi:hypothetical protein